MPTGNNRVDASDQTQPTLNQYLNISNFMYYGQTLSYAQSGLQADIGLAPLTRGGKPVEVLDNKTGLFAEAFVTTGSGPKQILIGYEGTSLYKYANEFTGAQAYDDAAIFAGRNAVSFKGSARFAERVINIGQKQGVSKSEIFLTGHSLGAAEAEYAARKTGLAGDTFGTPGIKLPNAVAGNPLHGRQSKLTNYVNYGDPVGNYAVDGPNPFGAYVISRDTQHYGGATLLGSSSNQMLLNTAVSDLQQGNTSGAVESIGEAAVFFHPLAGYAYNLSQLYPSQNIQLYELDGSVGADAGFFSAFGSAQTQQSTNAADVICFVTGTSILTDRGEVAVEKLRIGDRVATASRQSRPVIWIGQRRFVGSGHGLPHQQQPVRITVGAFGARLPTRDLLLSPGHPVLVGADEHGEGGHLVPIMCLVNGTTIARVPVDTVTYWHVELDEHDILLAEGLPAESYIDLGSRPWFAGTDGPLYDPDLALAGQRGRCRPVAVDGPVVEAERRRLDAVFEMSLVANCGWPAGDMMSLGF